MSKIEIRQVDPEEFITYTVNQYAFGATPAVRNLEDAKERLPYFQEAIPLAVLVDGEVQATSLFRDMSQNVRGNVLGMSGLGGVASLPMGRRQGLVRQMLYFGFEKIRERGLPVAALYPFRESFYQRMGYVSCAAPRYASIKPETLAGVLRLDLQGEIRHTDMARDFDTWHAFLEEQVQPKLHGFSLGNRTSAQLAQKYNSEWLFTVTEHDVVTGGMSYRISGHLGEMYVSRWYATTVNARYQMLAWAARHVDQVKTVKIKLGPTDFPETWWPDLGGVSRTDDDEHGWPPPMNRVLDIRGIEGIGCGEGEIVVSVTDEGAPWNTGTWALAGDNGKLRVTPSTATPAANLTIAGLSALVYNGSDPETFAIRGYGEVEAKAQETLRGLFPPVHVTLHEEF